MRTTFIETLMELAERDQRIWLLTADLGFSVLEAFAQRFPDRFVNVGIAEQNMIGVAVGLARSGLKPFVYSIANFPTIRCLEQIRNDVCYHHADVKIVAVGGGLAYGPQGYTHHGVEDLAVMRCLPGMTVVAPGDPVETRLAVDAIVELDGPAYLRLGKNNEPILHTRTPNFKLGKGIVLRAGNDLTMISTGTMLADALQTAEALELDGIQARVISMPTLKPLDEELIVRAAKQSGAILTLEEHSVTGGLGSAVADVLMEAGVGVRFRKLGVADQPYHLTGKQEYLKRELIGDPLAAARALIRRSRPGRRSRLSVQHR